MGRLPLTSTHQQNPAAIAASFWYWYGFRVEGANVSA